MSDVKGHIELDRSLDSITVGSRYRKDPGDLSKLIASIEQRGMLQPITITPEGILVCGWRRLEAVRRLGWTTLRVWVRSGVSTQLQAALSEHDDNLLHKPLNEIEKATLYRELVALEQEEADLRKKATQFRSKDGPAPGAGPEEAQGDDGAAPGAGPEEHGDARSRAARALTGKDTYNTHERVCALMDWAERKQTPPQIRAMAADALRRIKDGEHVTPLWREVKAAYEATKLPVPEDPETENARLAREAFERAVAAKEKGRANHGTGQGSSSHFRSVRSFNLTWTDLDGWTEMYDVDALAAELTDADWQRFDRVFTATIAFHDQLVTARRHAGASA